jgi:hypothetical protein
MTRVPSTTTADGSTPWFKIASFGNIPPYGPYSWALTSTYAATIPACLTPGDYLVRIENLAIHGGAAIPPEFYVSCAQVQVTGGGNRTFEGVRIPGHVRHVDPGYAIDIYDGKFPETYQVPGPEVSTC